jgi:hypothetical protein
MSGLISVEFSMARIRTRHFVNGSRALGGWLAVLVLSLPWTAFGHKAELSSWLTLQRDTSGWVALVEVRVPAKVLELGVNIADVSRDGKLSEQEFLALSRDYVRRVLATLDVRLGDTAALFKVGKVSWKGQGNRTLDIVASVAVSPPARPELRADSLSVTLRKGAGTVVLAVQTQAPWYLRTATGVSLGPDRRGFSHPLTLVAERPVRVDLAEAQPSR